MKNEWTIEEFKATTIEENIEKKIFYFPSYQRGLVWSHSQISDLVDTIKKGLPFGTLLLYKTDKNIYQIIDGSQRSSAIISFVKNPTQFFDENDIDSDVIKQIVDIIDAAGNKVKQEETVKNLLIKWVKQNHKTVEDVRDMQFAAFGQVVSKVYPTCERKEFIIGDLIKPMMKQFKEICETISNIKIPAIVMSGDPGDLPLLFERINRNGTQLSKYQVYAATWNSIKFTLKNHEEIVKANRDRYDQMYEGAVPIEDYDSAQFLIDKTLDTFEIAFGLGKHLSKTYPHLFGESKDDTKVDSIGFTLLGTCLGVKYTKTDILHKELNEKIGQENIDIFLDKILDAVKYVDNIIGKFSKFKSNRRASNKKPLHSEMQIAAIIASVFLMKWATIKLDDNGDVEAIIYNFQQSSLSWKKKYKKEFETNVSKRYLVEIFRKKWSGTGNVKLDQMILTPYFYTEPVDKNDFASALDNWFSTMNEERKENNKIATPKEAELAFLAAVYLPLFTAAEHLDDTNYDIEHLATQKQMKSHLARIREKDENFTLPISSVGNLCLLPEYANRSKKDKTLYDDNHYLARLKNYSLNLKKIEEKYSFTQKEDLEWINDNTSSAEELKTNYMKFIENHFNKMKNILLEHYDEL